MLSLGQYSIFRRDVSNLKFSKKPVSGTRPSLDDNLRIDEVESLGGTPSKAVMLKIKLESRGHKLGFDVPEDILTSYLGNKPCWMMIKVKGKILYKKYNPTFEFSLPKDIGSIGEEADVRIKKVSTYEFIRDVISRGKKQPTGYKFPLNFDIILANGGYKLVVKKAEKEIVRLDLILKEDLHYEDGGIKGPAVTFVMRDYRGVERVFKIAYNHEEICLFELKTGPGSGFRRILDLVYREEWKRLIIRYDEKGKVVHHRMYFEDLHAVLLDRVKELKKEPENQMLIGRIGEEWLNAYERERLKKIVSEITSGHENELKVIGPREPREKGPDFNVYFRDRLVAIVEVKTTGIYEAVESREKEAVKQLHRYFSESGWKDARCGIVLVVLIKDLDGIISSNFSEGIEIVRMELVENPSYRGP
jgi:hypothetical protein